MTLCDAHIHVVGDDPARMIPSRTYTPPPAAIETLQGLAKPLGITRFIVVQPSFYGTDNREVLKALRVLGPDGAGVAVVDPAAVTDAELQDLASARVRGLRINLYSTHGLGPGPGLAARFGAMAAVAGRMGWHVQVIAKLPVVVEAADVLAGSPVPVVIDHYGLPEKVGPGSEAGRRFLALLREPHVWVKLSAPYRWTGEPLGIRPEPAWVESLLEAAGERCVWGSDWPHTPAHEAQLGDAAPLPYRPLDYRAVVEGFRAALPERWAERVMGENPGRLYGFD